MRPIGRSLLVCLAGVLLASLAMAAPASAGKFNGYMTCSGLSGDPDSSCVEGDFLAAIFRSKEQSTHYRVCLSTPAGTKKCATKQTHGFREPSPFGFFSSGLGIYRAVWRVHGHGVVDRAEMRLRSEGVRSLARRDGGDRCSDGPRFYVNVLKGEANCSNARRALRGFMDNVYGSSPPCYPGKCTGESPRHWRCQLENKQLTEEAGRTAKCKRVSDGSVAVLIYRGESVTGAKRAKPCGSFGMPGLMTQIQVKITDGDFPCKIARRVMEDLFHGRDTEHWACVGPQTGYARCDKPNRGTVVGRF